MFHIFGKKIDLRRTSDIVNVDDNTDLEETKVREIIIDQEEKTEKKVDFEKVVFASFPSSGKLSFM